MKHELPQHFLERGEKPQLINLFCEAHGDLGDVPVNMVQDAVEAHEEKYGCVYPIQVTVAKQEPGFLN